MKLFINLPVLLAQRNMNQSDLSKKTKIRAATINEYYNNIWVSIKKSHIEKICEVLECDIDEVFILETKTDK